MVDVVIVAARRSAVGKLHGGLADLSAAQIGAAVLRQTLDDVRQSVSSDQVDEVIIGQVLQANCGMNPARQTAIMAGLPETVPAYTVNLVCGSGLKSVALGMQSIQAGDADMVVCGGQESMSNAPHAVDGRATRRGQKMGNLVLKDTMINEGLWCAFNNYHMGVTAENIAESYGVSRADMDEFAASSQAKAVAADDAGRFKGQIVPVGGLERDEYINRRTGLDRLQKLKPAFKPHGTVTAGNASGINDGAAFVVLMSAEKAKQLGAPILARCKGFASAGLDPKIMGMGPVPAVKKLLRKVEWQLSEVGLVEANEAFAAQSLAVVRELGLDRDKVNVNGGAIAIGHPIGASGARILVDLIHEMKRRNVAKGIATLCIGGGQGVAMAVEQDVRSRL